MPKKEAKMRNQVNPRGNQRTTEGWRDGGGDAATQVETVDEANVVDYSDYTKQDLQDALAARGLPVYGNKPDLIARLEENDAE